MDTSKPNNVVEKFDPAQLAEHHSGLDFAYRMLQRAYKAMTYEAGRLEDEPGLKVLGADKAPALNAMAERLQALGQELKQFANGEQHEEETEPGPKAAG